MKTITEKKDKNAYASGNLLLFVVLCDRMLLYESIVNSHHLYNKFSIPFQNSGPVSFFIFFFSSVFFGISEYPGCNDNACVIILCPFIFLIPTNAQKMSANINPDSCWN